MHHFLFAVSNYLSLIFIVSFLLSAEDRFDCIDCIDIVNQKCGLHHIVMSIGHNYMMNPTILNNNVNDIYKILIKYVSTCMQGSY